MSQIRKPITQKQLDAAIKKLQDAFAQTDMMDKDVSVCAQFDKTLRNEIGDNGLDIGPNYFYSTSWDIEDEDADAVEDLQNIIKEYGDITLTAIGTYNFGKNQDPMTIVCYITK